MGKLNAFLAHAFALEEAPVLRSGEDEALLDRLAAGVVRRGFKAPALLFLHSVQPLNFVGSQAMLFLQPMVGTVFSVEEWDRAAGLLERRETLARLVERMEKIEAPSPAVPV